MSEGEKERERIEKNPSPGERDHSGGKELIYIQLRFSAKGGNRQQMQKDMLTRYF